MTRTKKQEEIYQYHKVWAANNIEKTREYGRTYYHKHHSAAARGVSKRKPWDNARYRLQWHLNRYQAIEMLDGVCIDCGYKTHLDALQFDHIPSRGTKTRNIKMNWSWKRIEEELAKCELVCANCHAIRTVKRLEEKLNA